MKFLWSNKSNLAWLTPGKQVGPLANLHATYSHHEDWGCVRTRCNRNEHLISFLIPYSDKTIYIYIYSSFTRYLHFSFTITFKLLLSVNEFILFNMVLPSLQDTYHYRGLHQKEDPTNFLSFRYKTNKKAFQSKAKCPGGAQVRKFEQVHFTMWGKGAPGWQLRLKTLPSWKLRMPAVMNLYTKQWSQFEQISHRFTATERQRNWMFLFSGKQHQTLVLELVSTGHLIAKQYACRITLLGFHETHWIQSVSQYRSGTVNSNTVNSKFHLIRSYCEILIYHFPNISCLKCTVNSNFHLIRSKTLLTKDFELTVPDL